jgi:hypothetical protein
MNEIEWLDKVQKNFRNRDWIAFAGTPEWVTVAEFVKYNRPNWFNEVYNLRATEQISLETYVESVSNVYDWIMEYGA